MLTVIQIALAFLKAVPVMDKWFQALTVKYVEWKVSENDKAFLEALAKAKKGSVADMAAELGKLTDD